MVSALRIIRLPSRSWSAAALSRNLKASALILAFHSQGQQIYWKYQDIQIPGAKELGEVFAKVSGYTLEDTPYASGFAGYKDWFILRFGKPGYTVEVGQGENPLPLEQFPQIYRDNLGILVTAALGRGV